MATWKNNPDLMDRLGNAQNHMANINQDVMTWAGMCRTREELERHVEFYEGRVLEADIAALVAASFGKKKTRRGRAA